jgi:serine/threonine-protein kinase HipA
VQFVRPDRLDDVRLRTEREIEWLSEEGVAERLRDLVHAHGTGRLAGDAGEFSLAGAQPKMPLLYEDRR